MNPAGPLRLRARRPGQQTAIQLARCNGEDDVQHRARLLNLALSNVDVGGVSLSSSGACQKSVALFLCRCIH